MEINDPQLSNIALCRKFDYYVNPLSTKVSELGTKSYPYKELDSVLVEIMNFHSNSDRTINVYIMEDSTVYIQKQRYILNITSVNFLPYSQTSNSANKAKVVFTESEDPIIPPSMPSKFNIMTSKTLNTDELLINNADIPSEVLSQLTGGSGLLHVYMSTAKFENFYLATQLDSISSSTIIFRPVTLKNETIAIYD